VNSVQDEPNVADRADRRRYAALAGHRGDEASARAALTDPDPGVRATALGALARIGRLTVGDVAAALADSSPGVRRRAIAAAVTAHLDGAAAAVLGALHDTDTTVGEVAAWALGELSDRPAGTVAALAETAVGHQDALCREAAVAALGAIGDPTGLEAILAATHDKPAVRRRAVLALAPFEGPEVEAALAAAGQDRDWQVRQAAEDLGARQGGIAPSERP
jgi:HEAT repeat protein